MSEHPRVDIVYLPGRATRRLRSRDADTYLRELARLLVSLGLACRVLQDALRPWPFDNEGLEVVDLPAEAATGAAATPAVVADAVRGADLVIVSPLHCAAGMKIEIPLIGIDHDRATGDPPDRGGPDAPVAGHVVDAVRACTLCVSVDGTFGSWVRSVDGEAAARVRYLPAFVDLERFHPLPKRFDGRLEILLDGEVCDEHGVRDALAALGELLPRLTDVDLHVRGELGDQGEAMATALLERHPRRVQRSRGCFGETSAAYATSHIVLVPCALAGNVSSACLEAMATRNVVVTADTERLPGLVIDGWNAIVVRPGPENLTRAVERLARNRGLLERLAINALTTVPASAVSRWRARFQRVLHEAIPQHVPDGDVPPAEAAPDGLEGRIEELRAALDDARGAQRFAEQQYHWASSELAGIKASTGWALLQPLYQVRFALFPRGSRREMLAKRVLKGARMLARRNEGSHPTSSMSGSVVAPGPLPRLPAPDAPSIAVPYALVCLPILEWSFRFQRPQQLAARFAASGHEVLFAKHTFGDALSSRTIAPGIEEIELPCASSMNPYRDRMSEDDAERMAEALLAHLAARNLGRFVCSVQLPFWAPLAFALRRHTGCDVVYDCMDLHEGFSSNTQEALYDERRLCAESDLVVVSSELLAEHARRHSQHVALVRNGVDYQHFGRVPDHDHAVGTALTIGYYGAIADWFDTDLVSAIARRRPEWRIDLIGSTWSANIGPLEVMPNITLAGEQPYERLPALIADWACCVIPFLHTPLTEATNPVKVYEMLAAGKPVVSVTLPELDAMARDGLVALAEGPEAFVDAIELAVATDNARLRASRRTFAAQNTWDVRQRAFATAIDAIEPLVSVIIVTYNNRDLNELCLQSVLYDTDWPSLEVIVVDNASSDGTPELLRSFSMRDHRVRVILNEDNKGFAAANNQGAVLANGRYLCFLNNDTVVHGAWLRTMVGHLRRHAQLGLVGPVTNAIGNEAKIPVGYADLAGMPSWATQHCEAHRGELDAISMLAFFCVTVPRDVWRRVGPLDERFGTGMFEDDDYNRRVRAAGFDVRLARDAFVHHWQRASFKLLGEDEYLRIYRENEKLYARKWSEPAGRALAPLHVAAAAARATVIFAPSVGWEIPLAQRPHHLARVLAREGYAVVFDCTNAADEVDTLREIEPCLFLYKGPPGALAGLPRTVVWTFTYNFDYRDAFPAGIRVVYDWIDDLAVFPYEQRRLASMHVRALREADVVVSVARRLHEQALRERPDALYVPNAVEEGRFEREPDPNPALADPAFGAIVAKRTPIAGYYGALAHWFDYALLGETAQRRPDWAFVLIGPDHDGSLARSGVTSLPNVHALGARPYAMLPGYLHRFDVATIPFAINDITLATSPLKLYEYFAAGKAVISSAMPECAAFDVVRIVHDATEFALALDAARTAGRDSSHVAALREIAAANTWRARARDIMAALESRAPTGTAPVS